MKKKWLMSVLICGLIYTSFLQLKIYQYSHSHPFRNAEFLIILGARVKGMDPSLVLKYRINEAALYMKENPRTIAIASGGKGAGEQISEALVIKEGLIKKGIDQARIVLEDQSTTTEENLSFSKKLIPAKGGKGIIVTNTFHMYRARSMANDKGLNVSGLAADTPLSAIPKAYSREYLAISKYYLLKFLR